MNYYKRYQAKVWVYIPHKITKTILRVVLSSRILKSKFLTSMVFIVSELKHILPIHHLSISTSSGYYFQLMGYYINHLAIIFKSRKYYHKTTHKTKDNIL